MALCSKCDVPGPCIEQFNLFVPRAVKPIAISVFWQGQVSTASTIGGGARRTASGKNSCPSAASCRTPGPSDPSFVPEGTRAPQMRAVDPPSFVSPRLPRAWPRALALALAPARAPARAPVRARPAQPSRRRCCASPAAARPCRACGNTQKRGVKRAATHYAPSKSKRGPPGGNCEGRDEGRGRRKEGLTDSSSGTNVSSPSPSMRASFAC